MKDLENRYIYAVTSYLPKKGREDIELELRSLIEDMLEERCKEVPPTEEDVKAVLAELGPPAELAGKYSPDKQQALIGPAYMPYYRLVLKIVLITAFVGLTTAGLLNIVFFKEQAVYLEVLSWLGNCVGGLLSAFGAVTLVFAIMQYKAVNIEDWENENSQFFDNLPPVPEKKERISRSESVVSIVLGMIFTGIVLFIPQLFGGFYINGKFIPLLDAQVMQNRWVLVVLVAVLSIIYESVKLYYGRYTMRLGFASVILNLTGLALTVALFADGKIFATGLTEGLAAVTGWQYGQMPMMIFENMHLLILFCIVLAFVVEIITDVYKGFLYAGRHKEQC